MIIDVDYLLEEIRFTDIVDPEFEDLFFSAGYKMVFDDDI